jgi:hypothetical protein
MNDQHDSAWAAVGKVLTFALAWLGSWKLAEIQLLVGIVSGLIVAGFAATQWYVLWRDKIKGKRHDEAAS